MADIQHFTSVRFNNFKAFKNYSVSLKSFNVLVGPNNSGKSTIIGAFRILSEGIRKAKARKPEFIQDPKMDYWGYSIALQDLPISTENVFSDYNDAVPADIEFRLSNGNILKLHFTGTNGCHLICEPRGRPVSSPTDFKREYNINIGFVPILGPVEHKEPLYQKEAARLALLTPRAARNFRNIWYHYPENFEVFRSLIKSTWPGMDIEKPEISYSNNEPILYMFCPEERLPREIFWAGFGFQVWCQMLTFIIESKVDSLLLIDEPDIYLHSDLQRQLVGILKGLGPDILIATHSTEIISEAEPDDLLVINKRSRSAKRIKDPSQLQSVFDVLGSNLNPVLTQLAKSKRAVFVEGKDFQMLSLFARKLGKDLVANRSDFAVIPVEGFNPKKVLDFSRGIELTLGMTIAKAVIFDRDYRSDSEVKDVLKDLNQFCALACIHRCKEIENFLLVPSVIERSIRRRIADYNKRAGKAIKFEEDVSKLLLGITKPLKNKISGQYLAKRTAYEKGKLPGFDAASINEKIMSEFDALWTSLPDRLQIVPGKNVLSLLNQHLQEHYQITISPNVIIDCFDKSEIPNDIIDLINKLDALRSEED